MIKLIASDMDGTLLDERGQVPEETYELIRALRERGVHFVASSGRRYDTLRWFLEPVADEISYVASLGTQVFADGQLLDREVFSSLSVMRLFETCAMFDCLHLAVYEDDNTYLIDDLSSYISELDKDLVSATRVFDPPSPTVNIIKAAVCCDQPELITEMAYVLERELGEWFTFLPSGSRWIDVAPRARPRPTPAGDGRPGGSPAARRPRPRGGWRAGPRRGGCRRSAPARPRPRRPRPTHGREGRAT